MRNAMRAHAATLETLCTSCCSAMVEEQTDYDTGM